MYCKIIILILIILILLKTKLFYNENYVNNLNLEIKESELLKNNERGLYAMKDYKAGDIIEFCPTLKMNKMDVNTNNILHRHFFQGSINNNSLLSLGYCSLINHSKAKQNVTWNVSKDDSFLTMYAITDIKKGEEFYSNYGDEYWKNKTDQK